MKTACGKCKWMRRWFLAFYCVVSSDFLDFLDFVPSSEYVFCRDKNKGDCLDFELLGDGE